jgi:hypothetical protein
MTIISNPKSHTGSEMTGIRIHPNGLLLFQSLGNRLMGFKHYANGWVKCLKIKGKW